MGKSRMTPIHTSMFDLPDNVFISTFLSESIFDTEYPHLLSRNFLGLPRERASNKVGDSGQRVK